MRERGYSIDDFEHRASDISVDHPAMVEHYRTAQALHLAQERGDIDTEAFVHYHALFEKLVETDLETEKDTPREAGASPRTY
jgi:hypothetical protein